MLHKTAITAHNTSINDFSSVTEQYLLQSFFWLSNREGIFKIFHFKLRFIETEGRSLVFHYENLLLHKTAKISDFQKLLPEHTFFQCNISYIVNINYIDSIIPDGNRYKIHLITGETLPLSKNKRRQLQEYLKEM